MGQGRSCGSIWHSSDPVVKVSTPQELAYKYNELLELFNMIDIDHDGQLTCGELWQGIKDKKIKLELLQGASVAEAFEKLDKNSDGVVDFAEFLEISKNMLQLEMGNLAERLLEHKDRLRAAFEKYAGGPKYRPQAGVSVRLSLQLLYRVAQEENLDGEEGKTMIPMVKSLPPLDDGTISLQEFIDHLVKLRDDRDQVLNKSKGKEEKEAKKIEPMELHDPSSLQYQMGKLEQWFREADRDHDGLLSPQEVFDALKHSKIRIGAFAGKTASQVMKILDVNSDGQIGWDEFRILIDAEIRRFHLAQVDALLAKQKQLGELFTKYDITERGCLTPGDIYKMLQENTIEGLEGMDVGPVVRMLDTDGDGNITFDEFVLNLSSLRKKAAIELVRTPSMSKGPLANTATATPAS